MLANFLTGHIVKTIYWVTGTLKAECLMEDYSSDRNASLGSRCSPVPEPKREKNGQAKCVDENSNYVTTFPLFRSNGQSKRNQINFTGNENCSVLVTPNPAKIT